MLAAFFVAARDSSGDVLDVHILRITDDIDDLFAQAVAGAQLVRTKQAAQAARRRNQHRHAVLDEPAPVVAALDQRIRQPEDAIRQGDQRADQQRNARNGQGRGDTGFFALLFCHFGRCLRPGRSLVVNRAVGLVGRSGGILVHSAELSLVDRGRALHAVVGELDGPAAGRLLKTAEFAIFDQLVQHNKHDADRPHAQHKRQNNGPPRELERFVCARAPAAGILVLVAAATAAVWVAGVCVAGPLILILHDLLLYDTVSRQVGQLALHFLA